MRRATSAVFLIGLAVLIAAVYQQLSFYGSSVNVGLAVNSMGANQVGTANLVTSVVLAYRGLDTLIELSILFTAATAGGMLLGSRKATAKTDPDAGFILRAGADLFFPLLVVVGIYIMLHGHLTPGGGFQGGVILASAFFVPMLARPGQKLDQRWVSMIEGLAGASFIFIGLLALIGGEAFLTPLFGKGELGSLFSAGSLPLLYTAVGLKVGAELAGMLAHLADAGAVE